MIDTVYIDCFSGVSGNMLLGALIDAGMPEQVLRDTIRSLDIPGCELKVSRVTENNLSAIHVQIEVKEEQPHRQLQTIEKIITSSDLDLSIQEKAVNIFRNLGEAEASVHGCKIEDVHFHEVGAIDALVDVVGVVAGFSYLGIKNIYCSPLPMPHGWVNCAHGELPVPAPAVCKLLQGKPVYGVDLEQELVTPTGIVIVHTLAENYGLMPPMIITQTGYGAGSKKRSDGRPNLLRLITGNMHQPDEAQKVEVIETALDDWNSETWPHVADRLFHNGALDVILIPVHMKKGRPGFLLKVICELAHAQALKQVILNETSSIGLRFHSQLRMTLPREIIIVQTKFGPLKAKKIETSEGIVVTPEFEDCRRAAIENDVPIREVYSEINRCSQSSN